MNKSILILGAGLMQKPAILSAKELGFTVYLIDANPKAVCVSLADYFEPIDLKDREKIAEYALKLKTEKNLKAIFTAGTDFSASVSYASEKCSLPSHSFEASLNASDKVRMRTCFEKSNVSSPSFIQLKESELNKTLTPEFIRNLKYPLVVKPVDNMGARGCRMIRNQEELDYSIKQAVKNSKSKTAILEQYMKGPEYSIDALVYNGTMTITGFADRHIFFPPYFIETGHTMPTNCSKAQYEALIQTFAKGAHSLGLTCGAAKADIKFTAEGPMIGEIAARLSGGYMSGWTYPYASNLNLTKEAILIATGEKPVDLERKRVELNIDAPYKIFEVKCSGVSAERAWISIPGKVKKIYGIEEAKSNDYVENVFPRIFEDDEVVFPRNNVEKCGNVISKVHSETPSDSSKDLRDKAIDASEYSCKNITLRLYPNNLITQSFIFDPSLQYEEGFPSYAFPLDNFIEELKALDGEIPENAIISDYLPKILSSKDVLKVKDWNHLTLSETIAKFTELSPKHKTLKASDFWFAMIKGGIQGALYVSDCSE